MSDFSSEDRLGQIIESEGDSFDQGKSTSEIEREDSSSEVYKESEEKQLEAVLDRIAKEQPDYEFSKTQEDDLMEAINLAVRNQESKWQAASSAELREELLKLTHEFEVEKQKRHEMESALRTAQIERDTVKGAYLKLKVEIELLREKIYDFELEQENTKIQSIVHINEELKDTAKESSTFLQEEVQKEMDELRDRLFDTNLDVVELEKCLKEQEEETLMANQSAHWIMFYACCMQYKDAYFREGKKVNVQIQELYEEALKKHVPIERFSNYVKMEFDSRVENIIMEEEASAPNVSPIKAEPYSPSSGFKTKKEQNQEEKSRRKSKKPKSPKSPKPPKSPKSSRKTK
eukprot:GCRY01002188.1.p1 GENE.GCRY01002188.1~~GCRY01002188.1.p1  ORF type:complete len:347 (-),score=72.55 GCRY01002188.1:369-1409(-)